MEIKQPSGREKANRTYLESTQNSEFTNPCFKEQQLSLQCLERNSDKDVCKPYFANYKTCKKFWDDVRRKRRQEGIMPYLPLPEEREEIKAKVLGAAKS